jgi:hypothetical protein
MDGTGRDGVDPLAVITGPSPKASPLARLLGQAYLVLVVVSALGLAAGLAWTVAKSLGA